MFRLLVVTTCLTLLAQGSSSTGVIEISTHSSVCITDKCEENSNRILRDIDPNVKPCDNFYEHMCNRNNQSTISWIQESFKTRIVEFLASIIDGSSIVKDRNTERIRKFHQSCLHRDSEELDKLVFGLRKQAQMMEAKNYDWSDMLMSITYNGFGVGQLYEVAMNLQQNNMEVS